MAYNLYGLHFWSLFWPWYIHAIFSLADYFWIISTRYSFFLASLVAQTVPDSPSLIPWLLQHPFSHCETRTHWPCSCIHIHRAAAKVVYFACCFVTSFHWPPYLLGKRSIQPRIHISPFMLWLMVFLCTCRWASLHVHNGWSDFAVPQVATGRSTPLGPHCK